MENMPLISIIVPIYKVESYLDKCISSITQQTYTNMEIILVDDGSPDKCGAMCDAWAEKDDRIKVIHKENGGLSDARNAGMAVATGELITFVDSDDWISPQMYQLLYESMQRSGSDIAACGVEMVWEDGTAPRMLTRPGEYILDGQQAMQAIIEESILKQPVWYKLYKTALVQSIPFAKGKYHEDVFWSYQAIGAARSVSVIDAPCYYYLQRGGSIMGAGFSPKRLDGLEAKIQRLEYVKEKFPALLELAKRDLFMSCLWMEQMNEKYLKGKDRENCEKKIRYAWSLVRNVFAQTLKEWIWMTMARISFVGTAKLRNILGIGT